MQNVSALKTATQRTYTQAMEHFLFAAASCNLTQGTLEWYRLKLQAFGRYLEQPGKTGALQEISEQDIRAFLLASLNTCREKGRTDYTVRRMYDALKIFYRFLLSEGMVFVNPMANIQPPRTTKKMRQPLSQEEVTALLAAPNKKTFCGFRDYVLLVMFLDTGLRLEEALTLKVSNVNLQEGTLLVMGKGRKERKVPFGHTLKNLFMRYLEMRGVIPSQELVFVNQYGQGLASRHMRGIISRLHGEEKPLNPLFKAYGCRALKDFYCLHVCILLKARHARNLCYCSP